MNLSFLRNTVLTNSRQQLLLHMHTMARQEITLQKHFYLEKYGYVEYPDKNK